MPEFHDLPASTGPVGTDLVVVENNPGASGVSQSVTVAQLAIVPIPCGGNASTPRPADIAVGYWYDCPTAPVNGEPWDLWFEPA